MQGLRARQLPVGWYPDTAEEVLSQIAAWEGRAGAPPKTPYLAAVLPHAGWSFSGPLAWDAVRGIAEGAQTVFVCGGHLPPGAQLRLAGDGAFSTPLEPLEADAEARDALLRALEAEGLRVAPDERPDNTVEIQLPLIAARAPSARVVWLRVPNETRSSRVGELAYRVARSLGRRAAFLGSSDLTHYGPAYGYMPAGTGKQAQIWVEEHNDRPILKAMAAMDVSTVVALGEEGCAACSSGAAAAAIGFARAAGVGRGRVLAYANSAGGAPGASFVGYGTVAYPEPQGLA